MKFVISSGHGKYIRGAAGYPIPPYLDEVDQARRVVEEVAKVLRADGHGVVTFHDDVSTTQSENLDRIVRFHNDQAPHDFDVSIHFNAFETTSKPMGTEVLYVSSAGQKMARAVVDKICENGFVNRGPKQRNDLAFLNGTHAVAVLVETAFCDSKADCDLYNAKFADVCHSIAEGLAGHDIGDAPELPPDLERRPVIQYGDQGDAVAEAQSLLGVAADGDFGQATDLAARQFQADYALGITGIINNETWHKLEHQQTPPPAHAEMFEIQAPLIMAALITDLELTANQAAGVLGNLGHECAGFTLWQEAGQTPPNGGWGWAQWTGSRRSDLMAWVEDNGWTPVTNQGQYGFLVYELEGSEKAALAALRDTTTVDQATETFMRKYERPGVEHLDRRIEYAHRALAAFEDYVDAEPPELERPPRPDAAEVTVSISAPPGVRIIVNVNGEDL